MQVTYIRTECRDKVSPNCTQTFDRKVQRGRPALNCPNCRGFASPAVASVPSADAVPVERECPCGTKFTIKPGRGRKPSKCEACRASGTVYRMTDDGMTEAIQADQLTREERERKEAAALIRATNLTERMQKLMRARGLA